jgi:galactonate dehydratase
LVAPHCPLGPISLAGALRVDVATPNFLIQERAPGLGYPGAMEPLADFLDIDVVDGCISRPTRPGPGVDID